MRLSLRSASRALAAAVVLVTVVAAATMALTDWCHCALLRRLARRAPRLHRVGRTPSSALHRGDVLLVPSIAIAVLLAPGRDTLPDLSKAQAADTFARLHHNIYRAFDYEEENAVYDKLAALPMPTIAVIDGDALGGGLELAMGADLRYLADDARVGQPEILFLDEPTTGVDPVSRKEFWDILHTIRDQGTTIIVSTAYMDEANLCDRVSLFFNGKISVTNKPDILRDSFKYPLFQVRGKDPSRW